MLSAVLEDVWETYIEEQAISELAIAGLHKIRLLEPAASIERQDGGVRLLINGTTVATAPEGAVNDYTAWGATIERLIEDGKGASQRLQAASREDLYKILIDGQLSGLDRYSRYAGTEIARRQREEREGFGGIGISIATDAEGARIQHVTKDMPAARSGIVEGDIILQADGISLRGMPLGNIVRLLRGPVDTAIVLTLRRAGLASPFDVPLSRQRVIPLTVFYERQGRIAFLRMTGFNQDTTRELGEAVLQAQREIGAAIAGIVIDLRGNPGGLLDQAVDAADLFLVQGRISTTRGRHPDSHQIFDATPAMVGQGTPLVILIDGASASASEIFAAALQDLGRAVLIGSRSYGKGTVQTVLRLPNDGDLILTWARLLTPSGYVLNRLGVMPTLCTSHADSAASVLRRALDDGEALRHIRMRRNADGGDPENLKAIEALCPWQPRDGIDIDIEVARKILETPGLYQRALQITALPARS
ncbi:MAG: S41 family peptidase [Alphaproteobacteria bacterium]